MLTIAFLDRIPSRKSQPTGCMSEGQIMKWVTDMLELIDDGRIIPGIGDQAVGPTLIGRTAPVSELLGRWRRRALGHPGSLAGFLLRC